MTDGLDFCGAARLRYLCRVTPTIMHQKILLADDSVTIQRVIQLTFADEDFEVIAVSNGRQAIEQIEAARPDIVLTDIGMPERDGYEVCEYVKTQSHLAHVPVLLLTGAFEPIDEARAARAGCDGVLAKPFEPQLVIAKVKQLLGAKPAARAPREPSPAQLAKPVRPEQPRAAAARPLPDLPKPAACDPVEGLPLRHEPELRDFSAFEIDLDRPPPRATEDFFARFDRPAAAEQRDEPVVPDAGAVRPERVVADRLKEAPVLEAGPERADRTAEARSMAAAPASGVARLEKAAVDEHRDRPGGAAGRVRSIVAGVIDELAAAPAAPIDPAGLADDFEMLLAQEQGISLPPAPGAVSGRAPGRQTPAEVGVVVTDELVDRVARRVIERLSDRVVQQIAREVVPELAERLIKREIERLKAEING